jgi:hypothetical protein
LPLNSSFVTKYIQKTDDPLSPKQFSVKKNHSSFKFPLQSGKNLLKSLLRPSNQVNNTSKNYSLANLFKPRIMNDFIENESSKSLKRSRSGTTRKVSNSRNLMTSKHSSRNLLPRNRADSRPKRRLRII